MSKRNSAGFGPQDESPRWEAPVEWWYIHGRYGRGAGLRLFLTTLFRHSLRGPDGKAAFSYLGSVLDPAEKRHAFVSRIDRAYHPLFLAGALKTAPKTVDKSYLRAFHREMRDGGPLTHPFELREDQASLEGTPLRAKWADFALRQTGRAFSLDFREPGGGADCRFELIPRKPLLDIQALLERGNDLKWMAYNVYPRMDIRGTRGTSRVSGSAWMDHQWIDLKGGRSSENRRVPAWDWISINWEDGSDWVVFVQKGVDGRSIGTQFLTVSDPKGNPVMIRRFGMRPLEWWESPATGIRHPVSWRIRVPALSAEAVFHPSAEDQEIPVYGFQRMIWEGGGEAHAVIGGRSIRGTAWGEFMGYGCVFDAREHFRARARRIDGAIASFLPRTRRNQVASGRLAGDKTSLSFSGEVYKEMLARPAWDLLDRGGKRWRPLFALYLLDALGRDPAPYEQLIGCLAELCHTGALMVDDVEDASLLRRGRPAIHIGHGLDVAVSAGNTLYFLPALLIDNHPGLDPSQRLAMYGIYVRQMVRAHWGQSQDLFWSRNMSRENALRWSRAMGPRRILDAYALKTGSPLEGLAEMCAVVVQASPDVRKACLGFARALGVGFQILDDVHGFGRSKEWTKARGEDIAEGKWTYVLCRALRSLPEAKRNRLAEIVGSRELRKRARIRDEAIELVRESGVLERCRKEARRQATRSWKEIRGFLRPSEARIMLSTLITGLMDLDFQ